MEEVIQDNYDEVLCNIKKMIVNIEQLSFLVDKLNERFDRLEARVQNIEDRLNISEEYTSKQFDDSIDVKELVENNLDNINNKSQLEFNPQLYEDTIDEDPLYMNNNMEHIDTTYLVSTSSIDLKQLGHLNISNTIEHINYQYNSIARLLTNVATIPVTNSVPVTAYSSQFKVWDPGLGAA